MFSNKKIIVIIDKIPVRIWSAIIDQVSLTFASLFFSNLSQGSVAVYMAIFLFSIFLNKDVYFGRSIGKYLTGLRVVSVKTGNPASPIQCSVRNLFLLLWPLEALMLIFSPERRIGDFIAGTRVHESAVFSQDRKWHFSQATASIIVSFIIVFILFTYIDSLGIMS